MTEMVASFGSGPRCAPRRTVESTQKVAAPPHAGLARETLTLSVDGVPQEVEVVRQERFLGGTQAYWCCPKCGGLAPVRRRWRACGALLPSARLLVVAGPAHGSSCRSLAPSARGRAWFAVAIAAEAAALEPRLLSTADR